MGSASQALSQDASEVHLYIVSNPYVVTMLSFVGGLALVLVSFFGLFNIFGILAGPISYILQFYKMLFGAMICAIDGPGHHLPAFQSVVLKHASFLHSNTGRALFYLFLAGLEVTAD